MTRLLMAFSGAVFFGSIAAFFLFVPPMLIAIVSFITMALLLIAIMVMFLFSIQPELQPALLTAGVRRVALAQPVK